MAVEWVTPGEFLEFPVLDPDRLGEPQVWVQFSVTGDGLDPEALTARIGARPRRSERKGQYAEPLFGPWPTGCWELVLRVTDDDVERAFARLLDLLEPHGSFLRALRDVRMRFGVHAVLGVSPEWYDALSPETLARIGTLGAGLSLDLTCGRCY